MPDRNIRPDDWTALYFYAFVAGLLVVAILWRVTDQWGFAAGYVAYWFGWLMGRRSQR